MRLLLARHAAHGEVGRVLSGRTDGAGLSAEGRDQAARLGRRLRALGPCTLLASPRRRAQETAQILGAALGLAPRADPALDEIDFGAWTGRAFAALDAEPAWAAWNGQRAVSRPPGGEAMHEAQSRILRWIEGRRDGGDTMAVAITHADLIKAALCAFLGLSLDAHHRFDIAPASVSCLELWPGGGRVLSINDTQAPETPI